MKIEIELSEIESLRNQIKESNEEIKKLKEELAANADKKWEAKAIELSMRLLNAYFTAIFKKMGLEVSESWVRDGGVQLSDYVGDKWYLNKDKLTVNFNINVYNGVRSAYLNLGVITKPYERPEAKTMISEIDLNNDPK